MMMTALEALAVEHRAWPTDPDRYACPCGAGDLMFLSELVAHLIEAGAGRAPGVVEDLRDQLAQAETRVQAEIDWQYQIAARENAAAAEQEKRHNARIADLLARMDTWQRIGRRVVDAQRAGRKTVRIADLIGEAS